jgi:FixJ family two-component response regulator
MTITSLKPTIYIVDDDIDLCQSLQWLLESVGLVAKIFNNGLDFLAQFKPGEGAGCILLDIRMPQMSGLEVQEQLRVRHNTLPIIFMTGHGDVSMAVQAMKADAFDFLTKPFNDQVMLDQIHKAIAHHQKSTSTHKECAIFHQRLSSLTAREQGVLKEIVDGKLNKEIAFALNISIKTVELHRARIMEKMQASTIAQLIKFYLAGAEYE